MVRPVTVSGRAESRSVRNLGPHPPNPTVQTSGPGRLAPADALEDALEPFDGFVEELMTTVPEDLRWRLTGLRPRRDRTHDAGAQP